MCGQPTRVESWMNSPMVAVATAVEMAVANTMSCLGIPVLNPLAAPDRI